MAKLSTLEEKYKDKPKIAFHQLSDEGNKLFMQAKRDKVWTTIGWSIVGNVAGIAAVNYYETQNNKWTTMRHMKKREMMKVGIFLGTVCAFTLYGYGCARQAFVKKKLEIVESHSIRQSE